MYRKNLFSLAALAALILFVTACSDDDNPTKPPEFGSVAGRVTFVGAWPATGNVQVSIWASWPPAGPPSAATDPIPSGSVTFDYKIDGLNKGLYKALTVGWRNPANPAGAKVLGIYMNDSSNTGVLGIDSVTGRQMLATPVSIEITDSNPNLTGLSIKADLAYAQ